MIIPKLHSGLLEEGEGERDLLYERLIIQHADVFNRVCDKYWFIRRDERDDYIQEMKLHVWLKFYKWLRVKSKGIEFEQWLFMEGRAAAFSYRCKLLHINKRDISRLYQDRVVFRENMESFEIIDIRYDEARLLALDKAISDLKPGDRWVVAMYLEGHEMEERSVADGKKKSYYGGRMAYIRNTIRENRHRYFDEDVRLYDTSNPNKSRGANSKSVGSKAVHQFGLDGRLLYTWPSTMEAERSGLFNAKNIQQAAKGEKVTHRGCVWLYVGDEAALPDRLVAANKAKGKADKKPILQLSLEGKVIRRWETIRAATKCGFHNIQRVCEGKQATAAGFKWKWAEAC